MPTPQTPSKLLLFEKVAMVLKAMADPVRLLLLHQLQAGELCVGKLVDSVCTSQANVSKHLSVLRQAGLVSSRRDRNRIIYAISDPAVFDICSAVGGTIERRLNLERKLMEATMKQLQADSASDAEK
jgi:DNA-binding transcriptional ArsR family regulator